MRCTKLKIKSSQKFNENPLKVLVFINVDWFALSHFKHYLNSITIAGNELIIVTRNTGKINELKEITSNVVEIDLKRGYVGIIKELIIIWKLFFILKNSNAEVFEFISIKPIVFGGLISKFLSIKKIVYYLSGLGSQFTDESKKGIIKRYFFTFVYKTIMNSKNSTVLVENEDDFYKFKSILNIHSNQLKIIKGVGVDLKKFKPKYKNKENKTRLKILMVSRLLYDKGLVEFFQAAEKIYLENKNVEFLLAGAMDKSNPACISSRDYRDQKNKGIVKFLGHQDDISMLLREVDIFVLPSYREGFPRVIMEASASGLPIVTTNVPGCRSAIINNSTGILVEPKNYLALAGGINTLIKDFKLRKKMSLEGRRFSKQNFNEHSISEKHIQSWSE